jgi:hypothetical protein
MFHLVTFELEMIESGKCVRSVVRLIKFDGYKKKALTASASRSCLGFSPCTNPPSKPALATPAVSD